MIKFLCRTGRRTALERVTVIAKDRHRYDFNHGAGGIGDGIEASLALSLVSEWTSPRPRHCRCRGRSFAYWLYMSQNNEPVSHRPTAKPRSLISDCQENLPNCHKATPRSAGISTKSVVSRADGRPNMFGSASPLSCPLVRSQLFPAWALRFGRAL